MTLGVYAYLLFAGLCETPDQISSQVKLAPTGVDEQVGILLSNPKGEMATIALTLHAKQPKRGTALPTIKAILNFMNILVVKKLSSPKDGFRYH